MVGPNKLYMFTRTDKSALTVKYGCIGIRL